jgi:hyperosmotically inducible protein
VKNGHVTLEGVVDDEADRNIAGIRANGVADVFSVTNDLQIAKWS